VVDSLTRTVKAHNGILLAAEEMNIKLDAAKGNLILQAKQDLHLATAEGKAEILVDQTLKVVSVKKKEIQFQTGRSVITMTEEKITIQADTIEFLSNDKKLRMQLGKTDGVECWKVDAKSQVWIDGKDDIWIKSKEELTLDGKPVRSNKSNVLLDK
jgi:hypothetical protein